MKARHVLVPLVAVIGGITAWVAFANRGSDNDLALLETPPYPLVVIPRSVLGKKPLIDWKPPIIGRIRVPSTITPSDYVDNMQVAGLIHAAISPSGLSKSDIRGLLWFSNFHQIDFGNNHIVEIPDIPTQARPGSYITLPYVFGKSPREATLRSDPASWGGLQTSPDASLRIRLPANGQEPNLRPVDVAVEPWVVRLTPHWFSPSLPLLLDLRVLGLAKNQEVWIRVERQAISGDGLKVRGSGVKTLPWYRWADKQPLTVRVFSPIAEKRELRVSIKEVEGGTKKQVRVLWEDGSIAASYNVEPRWWWCIDDNPKSYLSVLIGRELMAGDFFLDPPNDRGEGWNPTKAKDGQILKATCYRAVRSSNREHHPALPRFQNLSELGEGRGQLLTVCRTACDSQKR